MQDNKTTNKPGLNIHPLIFLACMIIIIAGVKAISPVLNIVLVALLLSVSVLPVLTWQLRRGWSRTFALGVTILLVVVVGFLLAGILGLAINNMAAKIPVYKERVSELFSGSVSYLSSKGINMSDVQSLELFSPEKMVSIGTTFLEGIFSTFGNFVFVLLLMIFILIQFADIHEKAEKGEFAKGSWQTRFSDIANDLKKYVSINAVTGFMAASANVVLLLVIGVDFAIMWGFLSFLFSFIPNIGFILSVIPPAMIAFLEYGWVHSLIVVIGFVVINSIVDNVIKPRFLGKEFNISLLLIFLSLLFWGWVLGPIGAILGVPLTMAVKKLIQFMNEDIEGNYDPPGPDDTSPSVFEAPAE